MPRIRLRQSLLEQGVASLVLEGKDKTLTLSGHEETLWTETIVFRGASITYRFTATADGVGDESRAIIDGAEASDWGYRFSVSILQGVVEDVRKAAQRTRGRCD